MTATDFTFTIVTDRTPQQVFDAVRNVRSWWNGFYSEEITGSSEKLHDEFSFRAGDGVHYSRQKLVEVIPNERVVWLIAESELSFIKDTSEWTGTKIVFDISEKNGKTALTFTHIGLTPEVECYDACAPAWSAYLQEKLVPLINNSVIA